MRPEVEGLLTDTRERQQRALVRRERATYAGFSAAFLLAAGALAVLRPGRARASTRCSRRSWCSPTRSSRASSSPPARGSSCPTQVVFVPMLLLLPTPLVPLLVAAAYVLTDALQAVRGTARRSARSPRSPTRGSACRPRSSSCSPDAQVPTWDAAPWYAVALLAQLGGDALHHDGPRATRARRPARARSATSWRSSTASTRCSRPVGLLAAFGAAVGALRGPARAPARRPVRHLRPRARGADRPRARALPGLPRHRAAARRRDRGRRPVHGRPHQGRRGAHAARRRPAAASTTRPAAAPSSGRCCTTSARSTSRTRSSTSPGRSTTTSG